MIVIGAGLCGLVAARNIAQKGYNVIIFESNDRIGGRTWTKKFPGTDTFVDIGGEFYDVNCHKATVEEVKRHGIPISRLPYKNSTAWTFKFPGNFVTTPATCPAMYQTEYDRVMRQINDDIGRVNFREGLDQGAAGFLDIPFTEYVKKRCGAFDFVEEYLMSEAATMFQTNPDNLSALVVLHCLAGFGTPEEILNTTPRLGQPFKKPEYARVDKGMGHLCEEIANEFLSFGGEIRLKNPIGCVVCEPVPKEGSKKYCAICSRYTFPFCSFHGPRVLVVDGMGRQYRARSCIVATPINCLPCFKFDPKLSYNLQHAAEICNVGGDSQKVWIEAEGVASDIDCVQSWSNLFHSHVKDSFQAGLGKGTDGLSVLEEEGSEIEGDGGDTTDMDEERRAAADDAVSVSTSSTAASASAASSKVRNGNNNNNNDSNNNNMEVERMEEGKKVEVTDGPAGARAAEKNIAPARDPKREFKRYENDYENYKSPHMVTENLNDAKNREKKRFDAEKRRYSHAGLNDYVDGRRNSVAPSNGFVTRKNPTKLSPVAKKLQLKELEDSTLDAAEREAREVRRAKRRASIQEHKIRLDHQDIAAGLRGRYGNVDSNVDITSTTLNQRDNGIFDDVNRDGNGDYDDDSSVEYTVGRWVTVLAAIGLKDKVGHKGDRAPDTINEHFPSAVCHKLLSHDWKSDSNLRGGMFAMRSGSAHLHADACKDAEKPWHHTENLIISGGDLSPWWPGWIEGAIASGNRSSKHTLHFLDPPVPVANHIERRYDDKELVKQIETERNAKKRAEKEEAKKRAEAEAKARKAGMFKY